MRYFDPILLKGREWPPAEIEVTPELIKEVPHQVADLYGQMPNLADSEWRLGKITNRIYELYERHENRNIGTEDLLAGNFPPLLLSYFSSINGWTEFMGLVLLSGFCPCALVGLSPSELLERNMPEQKMDGIYEERYGGWYAGKWELPGHPTAKWILEQVSCDENPRLLRLDGLMLSNTIVMEAYSLIRQPPPIKDYDANLHGQLLQQSHKKVNIQRQKLIKHKDVKEKKLIEYYDSNIHGQLLQQFHRSINILLLKWIEYRGANDWQVPKGKNVLRLPPREFVRFAEEIKFDIPWLGFAKAHFPHLLPEESTGRPTSVTDTAISADALEKLRSEKGAIESERDSPWPWGDHETKLLRKLADAAHEWWSTYDPEDTSTAPKNEEVSKWLEDHGVSNRVAEVMAQILRADGLPTGPRK